MYLVLFFTIKLVCFFFAHNNVRNKAALIRLYHKSTKLSIDAFFINHGLHRAEIIPTINPLIFLCFIGILSHSFSNIAENAFSMQFLLNKCADNAK